eukprot:gene19403-biopygen20027
MHGIQPLSTSIELCAVASDKADAIRSAFAKVWPNAKWVTRCPHMSTKPRKEWMKVMTSADKQPVLADVNENIKLMHTCRSRDQFQHSGKLAIHRLRTKFKEEQVATLRENGHMSVPYDCWYVTASGVVSCSPSSQPIEARTGK